MIVLGLINWPEEVCWRDLPVRDLLDPSHGLPARDALTGCPLPNAVFRNIAHDIGEVGRRHLVVLEIVLEGHGVTAITPKRVSVNPNVGFYPSWVTPL